MATPGLLVEYLVSGAIAFAWLFPSLRSLLPAIDSALLPIAFLLLYVLGMAVDMLAWATTNLPKRWIRKRVYRRYRERDLSDSESGTLRQAKIALYAPELSRELAMRSSRDRIARGCVVNSVLATVFVLPWTAGCALIIFTIVLWAGFERLSFGFELCAERAIDSKLEREATTKTH